jgi:hypothetical protein
MHSESGTHPHGGGESDRGGGGVIAGAPASVGELWVDTLERLCGRTAHELKGALNGVAVNLEVVRSRCERPNTSASAVGPYANSASDQLGIVIETTEALLALARSARTPIEVARVTRHVHALLAPAARSQGKRFELSGPLDGLGATSAGTSAARLSVAASAMAATDAWSHVICRVTGDDMPGVLRFESRDAEPAPCCIDGAIVDAAARSGIRIQVDGSTISITFPQ